MKLHTRLPIEECKARLTSGVDAERLGFSWSGYAGSKPILGKFRDNSFRLQKRRYYHNSFAPHFYGRFVPFGRETLIEGDFRIHRGVKVFMIAWFSFLILFTVATLASYISNRGGAKETFDLETAAGLAVLGVALIKFGRWLGRGEERAVLAFLKSTLETDAVSL